MGLISKFSSKQLLALFTLVNTLTYYDRGALAALLSNIEKEFNLDNTLGGILGGAYMAGYVLSSPVFAHFATQVNPLKMMASGLIVWCLATAGTGAAQEFYSLLLARALTGVGEASFLCLAPPFIDKFAPPDKRSAWLSIFYAGIPVGTALGYAIPSLIAPCKVCDQSNYRGPLPASWHWRIVFVTEAIAMVPLVLLCLLAPNDQLEFPDQDADLVKRTSINAGSELKQTLLLNDDGYEEDALRQRSELRNQRDMQTEHKDVWAEIAVLLSNGIYVCVVLASAAQTFVTGGFAYVGEKYAEDSHEVHGLGYPKSSAGSMFGGVTAAMGIIGTGFGGWMLDALRARNDVTHDITGSLVVAFKFLTVLSILALPCALLSVNLVVIHRGFFFLFLAFTEFFIFASLSPINSCILWCVAPANRPMAMAVSVIGIHVLGDATSPIIIGKLQDTLKNWSQSLSIASLWLIWPCALFPMAYLFTRRWTRSRFKTTESELASVLTDSPIDAESYSM